jgi:HD superfamily phosphodiesterase
MSIDELLPDDTAPVRGAREAALRYSSPSLFNHCARSYLWAASLGRSEGLEFDAELLYVAALLHDLGLVEAFDTHRTAFEEAGGDVGWVLAAGAGWPEPRRERVKEIVVRHMWDAVDPAVDAEGYLLHAATSLDISGRRAEAWSAEFQAEVLRAHPRLNLPEEFVAAFEDQAGRKPGCAAAAAVVSGIAGRIARNPLDRPA